MLECPKPSSAKSAFPRGRLARLPLLPPPLLLHAALAGHEPEPNGGRTRRPKRPQKTRLAKTALYLSLYKPARNKSHSSEYSLQM